ncbi:MAG: hypothetical protein MJZ37_00315 [Bacilli bacterium]|nr:hypothetical protein [Bacilli bacterium]
MTEVDEQVRKFIDFLDNDEALDKTIRHMKKINKFLKNEIAESKKGNEELRYCGNCQSVFDADGFCYLYKDGRCINQSEWTKRSKGVEK